MEKQFHRQYGVAAANRLRINAENNGHLFINTSPESGRDTL